MKKILLSISFFVGFSINLLAYNYGTMEQNTIGCKKGLALSCRNLGSNYRDKKDKKLAEFYFTKGTELFQEYCEGGNGKACYDLANIFVDGLFTINSNLSTAAKYYHKACDNKYGKGCIELGRGYRKGRISLKKDKKKSLEYDAKGVEYLTVECNNNIAASCQDLNFKKKTFKLYKKMCAQKDDEGCIQTAYSYHRGNGWVEIDWKKAKEYYKKSCDLGQKTACFFGKRLDISKQVQYEKERKLNYYIEGILHKENIEVKKWKDRLKKNTKKLNNPKITKDEKEQLIKRMTLEKKSWEKKSLKIFNNRQELIKVKKKEFGL